MEEIKTCNNNQKMSVYCKTCVCKSCEQVAWLEQENKRLQAENERLKKDFSSYEDDIEDWVSDNSILYQYDDRTPDTLEELQACMESTHEQWQKYKSALEEIKEMAIYDCQRECSNNSENCTIGSCLEQRIQRKINEVLK